MTIVNLQTAAGTVRHACAGTTLVAHASCQLAACQACTVPIMKTKRLHVTVGGQYGIRGVIGERDGWVCCEHSQLKAVKGAGKVMQAQITLPLS